MRLDNLLMVGIVGVAGYGLYRALKQLPKVTDPVSSALANLWVNLTAQPAMTVLGSVIFPDGNSVTLSSLEVRSDAQGGVYVKYAGHVYQLQPSDAFGNWPAVQVA